MDYLDFDVEITPGKGRDYTVAILRSPLGEARGEMQLPFDHDDLERRLRGVQAAVLRSASTTRGRATGLALDADPDVDVRDLGARLFGALFPKGRLDLLGKGQAAATNRRQGLRVRLHLNAPELAMLPWEFLYDTAQKDFLTLAASTPLVRFVAPTGEVEPLPVERPLRILGVIASPPGPNIKPLNVEHERQRLELAIAGLRHRGDIELHWLGGQTARYLQAALRDGPWHVLHFIGHGGFDRSEGKGFIILANDQGGPNALYATDLAHLVGDHADLRLVVLNACDGAKGNEIDLFSSSAAYLVGQGVPAVVAMQFEITDEAAIEFSRSFYAAIADGAPIDFSLGEARKAMAIAFQGSLEWGTPVLYTHAADGVLFKVGRARGPARARPVGVSLRGKVATFFDAPDAAAIDALAGALKKRRDVTTTVIALELARAEAGRPDGTTDALKEAPGAILALGPSGLGVWEHPAIARLLARRSRDPTFQIVPVLLPGAGLPDLAHLPDFVGGREWVDLRAGPENPDRIDDIVEGLQVGPGVGGRPKAVVPSNDPPYRGLEVFEEQHAHNFFGRELLTQELVARVRNGRFLAVVGPSGSGKSSVVRAGLIPSLHDGEIDGSATWPIVLLKPGSHPVETLAAGLAPLLGGDTEREARSDSILTALLHAPDGLHATVERALAEAEPDQRLVLVVDQFEEVFTLCQDAAEQERFIDLLLAAESAAAGRTVVVLTMRADFMGRAAAHPGLAAAIADHDVLVTAMTRDELRRAIVEPARRAGLQFEQGLVDAIMAEIGGEAGALPLLEDTLLELWEGRAGGWLTLERYRRIGGVRGALSDRADRIYQAMPASQQPIARRVLLALVEFETTGAVTRRRASLSEFAVAETGIPEAEVAAVIQKLVDARLITTGRDDGGDTVDVAHEALISNWEAFRDWIAEDGAGIRLHRQIATEARAWVAADHDPGLLWRGKRLAQALAWVAESHDKLDDVRPFLDASAAAEAAERQARLDAEAAAERARREAEEASRQARERQQRLRLRFAGLVVVVAVAGVGIAGWFANNAENARAAAEQARLEADAQAKAANGVNVAATKPLPGLAGALDGWVMADRAGIPTSDYRRAVETLLASGRIAALGEDIERLIPSPDGRYVVVDTASAAGAIVRLADGERLVTLAGQVSEVIVGPVGAGVFGVHYLDAPSELRRWDTGAAIELAGERANFQFPVDASGAVVILDYHLPAPPDSDTEVIGGAARVEVRSATDGSLIRRLETLREGVFVLAAPDGGRAVVPFDDGHLELVRMSDGATVGTIEEGGHVSLPLWGPPAIIGVEHSTDVTTSCSIYRTDDGALVSSRPRWSLGDATVNPCGVMAVSDDGTIASVSMTADDRLIRLGDLAATPLATTTAELTFVAIAPGEDPTGFLAFGRGGVDVWRVGDAGPVARLPGKTETVLFSSLDVTFSPDGEFATFLLDDRVVLVRMATGEMLQLPEGQVDPEGPIISAHAIDFGVGANGVLAHLQIEGQDGDTLLLTDPPVWGPFGRIVFWPGLDGVAITYAFNDWGPTLGLRTIELDNFQTVTFAPGATPVVALATFPRSAEDEASGVPPDPSMVVFLDGTTEVLRTAVDAVDFTTDKATATLVVRYADELSEIWDTASRRRIGILGLGVGSIRFDDTGRRLAVRYLAGDAYLVDVERLRAFPPDLSALSDQDLRALACGTLGRFDLESQAPVACPSTAGT